MAALSFLYLLELLAQLHNQVLLRLFFIMAQFVAQESFQRLGCQMTLEHAVHSHRDGAGLFRDDHHHSIGNFAHTHRRTVACAKVQTQATALGQGKHAACSRDPAIPDDHSTVMERCIGKEDIADQLLRNTTIDQRAGLEILFQVAVTGKDDQGTDTSLAHGLTGLHGLGNHRNHLLLRLLGTQELFQPHTA